MGTESFMDLICAGCYCSSDCLCGIKRMITEICANCEHWIICKAEGVMPNDYCGNYVSVSDEETEDEQ